MSRVQISQGERKYLVSGIASNIRIDGRSNLDTRDVILQTQVMQNAAGSARLQCGDADVLINVQLMIETSESLGQKHTSYSRRDQGFSQRENTNEGVHGAVHLMESAPSSIKPEGISPPKATGEAITFSIQVPGFAKESDDDIAFIHQRLVMMYSSLNESLLSCPDLVLIPEKMWWRFHVQVIVLQMNGLTNLLDAISMAIRAALRSTIIPRVELLPTDGDEPPEVLLDEDKELSGPSLVDAKNTPIMITLCFVGSMFVVDADAKEEACADAILTIGVNWQGAICGIFQKSVTKGIRGDNVLHAVKIAKQISRPLIENMDKLIDDDLQLSRHTFLPHSGKGGLGLL